MISGRPIRRDACALLALAMLCMGVSGHAADGLDALLALLAHTPHGPQTFTETQHLAVLDKPLVSSGELIYEPPDHLEKRTVKPRALSLSARGDVLTVQRGRRSHVVQMKDFPQAAPFIEGIRATLAGDRQGLEKHFSLSMSGSLDDWELQLTPLDPQQPGGVRQIRIKGHGGQLDRVDTLQSDGDRSELLIGPPP